MSKAALLALVPAAAVLVGGTLLAYSGHQEASQMRAQTSALMHAGAVSDGEVTRLRAKVPVSLAPGDVSAAVQATADASGVKLGAISRETTSSSTVTTAVGRAHVISVSLTSTATGDARSVETFVVALTRHEPALRVDTVTYQRGAVTVTVTEQAAEAF